MSHRTLVSWRHMIDRCTNPNADQYEWYGGRGILIHPNWMEYNNFLRDMGERPKGMTLSRNDNDGDYESSNCEWADHKSQCLNRRSTRWLTYKGETLSVSQWSERLGIKRTTITMRLNKYKWSIEKTLSTP